jgi:hypothetical protein
VTEAPITSEQTARDGAGTVETALSVIVPVYDQAGVIVENVRAIRDRISAGFAEPFELIVVSDGSVDGTAERMLESELPGVRVLYYDRNLGKGYAVKTGAREARGRWIAYCDADLDLDPGALPAYVAAAERDGLDFAIGSKRHPDSNVHYPRSRVVTSWMYQQLVRMLFRLDVRDTQVGLKVFRREVARRVVPLLLVKRYAFDIELLAVSRAFGFGRVREMPITLDYRFTGSGVRSIASLHAVADTLAVFYRLRILRYYQRRLAVEAPESFDSPVEVVEERDPGRRRAAAEASSAEVLAFLEPGAHPSANWISSSAPFFARPDIDAVVTPQLAPAGGSIRERGAASIAESRLGGGSLNYRFKPGAIRYVSDFPAASLLVRREPFLALDPETAPDDVVLELAGSGGRTLYLPEASVTIPPAPLFAPHLRRIASYGRARGMLVRRRGLSATRASTVALLGLIVWLAFGWLLVLAGPGGTDAWLAVWGLYLVTTGLAALFAGLRFRSLRVGLAAALGFPLTHAFYAVSFLGGLADRGAR